MGNPFLDDTPELLSLDKRHVIDEFVAHSIRSIEALGKEKFREYEKAVILDRTFTILLQGTPLHFSKGQSPS